MAAVRASEVVAVFGNQVQLRLTRAAPDAAAVVAFETARLVAVPRASVAENTGTLDNRIRVFIHAPGAVHDSLVRAIPTTHAAAPNAPTPAATVAGRKLCAIQLQTEVAESGEASGLVYIGVFPSIPCATLGLGSTARAPCCSGAWKAVHHVLGSTAETKRGQHWFSTGSGTQPSPPYHARGGSQPSQSTYPAPGCSSAS